MFDANLNQVAVSGRKVMSQIGCVVSQEDSQRLQVVPVEYNMLINM